MTKRQKKGGGTKKAAKTPVKSAVEKKPKAEPKPKVEESKLRLWVNPQAPKFSSVNRHVPKGVKVGNKTRLTYSVRYTEAEGPEGFVPPNKELYNWLLKQKGKRGVPIFLSEKPKYPKE